MRKQLFWGGLMASASLRAYRGDVTSGVDCQRYGSWQRARIALMACLSLGFVTCGALFILGSNVRQMVDRDRIGVEAQTEAQERWEQGLQHGAAQSSAEPTTSEASKASSYERRTVPWAVRA